MLKETQAANDVHNAWWRVSNAQKVFYRLEPGAMGHTSICESETAVGVAPCRRSS